MRGFNRDGRTLFNNMIEQVGRARDAAFAEFDFRHAFDFHCRRGRWFYRRVVLIAEQMLDVVNQQLLMLHLVFETEADERQNVLRCGPVRD